MKKKRFIREKVVRKGRKKVTESDPTSLLINEQKKVLVKLTIQLSLEKHSKTFFYKHKQTNKQTNKPTNT